MVRKRALWVLTIAMYAAMYAVMFESYACCHVRIIELLAVRKNLQCPWI